MYRLIEALYKESELVEIVCRVVSYGYAVRRQRKQAVKFDKMLWDTWNHNHNAHKLNKKISKLLNNKQKCL